MDQGWMRTTRRADGAELTISNQSQVITRRLPIGAQDVNPERPLLHTVAASRDEGTAKVDR